MSNRPSYQKKNNKSNISGGTSHGSNERTYNSGYGQNSYYSGQSTNNPQSHSSHTNSHGNQRDTHHNGEVKSREYSLPGTSSLHEMLDHRILILLRDQRLLIADLKSYDQFSNLVLENCIERICIQNKYGDLPLGTQLIRGENIQLLGTFQEDRMDMSSKQEVSLQDILLLQKEERLRKEQEEKKIRQKGLKLGLEGRETEDALA